MTNEPPIEEMPIGGIDEEIDALVVGAGPAGSLAARGLAQTGARVLLVDKAEFPRWKVCGCCINGAGLATLTQSGLEDLPRRLCAVPLRRFHIATANRHAGLDLPAGVALSRERLDHALANEAVAAGARFASRTTATWLGEVDDGICVILAGPSQVTRVQASVVLAADGLAAGFTRHVPGVKARAARHARIGVGTTVDAPDAAYPSGTIHMAVGRSGYVGLVRLEDGRLDIAAALDGELIRAAGDLCRAVRSVLATSGFPAIDGLDTAHWRGTPPLTRTHHAPWTNRVLLVGDAAAYVEPFTGEGIAWALSSGRAVVPFALDVIEHAPADAQRDWQRHLRELLGAQRRRCRWLALALRHPWLVSAAVRLLAHQPAVAAGYVRRLNRVKPMTG